jgi:hypothetical protein
MSDAVLQFEIDRKRAANYTMKHGYDSRTALGDAWEIALSALSDVWRNNGTFVLVASAQTITIVQRTSVEEISTKTKK